MDDVWASLWMVTGGIVLLGYTIATRRIPSIGFFLVALLLGPLFFLFLLLGWLGRDSVSDLLGDKAQNSSEWNETTMEDGRHGNDSVEEFQILLAEVSQSLEEAEDNSRPPKKYEITRLQKLGNVARKDAVREVVDVQEVIDLLERGVGWLDFVYPKNPALAERRREAILKSVRKLRKRLGATDFSEEEDTAEDVVIGSLSGKMSDSNLVWGVLDSGDLALLAKLSMTTELVNETRERRGIPALTPLMVVAQLGNLQQVKALVEAGANVNARCGGAEDYSPLLCAVNRSADPDVVLYLLESGADVNAIQPSEASFSALALSVCRGQRVVADLLLAHGADPFWRNSAGMNIIKMAVTEPLSPPSEVTLDKLAALGVSVHEVDAQGFFAIHSAATSCEAPIIRLLEKFGADLDQLVLGNDDESGSRPLALAAAAGNAETFFTLLELGANVELCLRRGAPFQPQSPETILDREGQFDILTRTLFRAAGRSHCTELEGEVVRIVETLVIEHGARPTLFTLAIALAFELASETRHLLFHAAREDLVPVMEGIQLERTLKSLSELCCAMMVAAGTEIDPDYLLRLEEEILELLGEASKPVKARVRNTISSLR